MTHDSNRNDPSRRTFLQASALAGAAAAVTSPANAMSTARRRGANGKVTVVLFQRGGADFLNLYAPTGDSHYATLRPTVVPLEWHRMGDPPARRQVRSRRS